MKQTLAILVNSCEHPDYVVQLAHAAFDRGKAVKVHFFGAGVLLAESTRVDDLDRVAELSVCRDSFFEFGGPPGLEDALLTSPVRMVDLMRNSNRYVVL
jgi:hypothetical protein